MATGISSEAFVSASFRAKVAAYVAVRSRCAARTSTDGNTIETTFLAGIALDPTGISTAGIYCAAITGNTILCAGLGTQPAYPRQSGGLPSGVPAGIILNADSTHVINDVAIVGNTVNSS